MRIVILKSDRVFQFKRKDMSYKKRPKGYATKAIHSGFQPEDTKSNAVVPPIVTSAIFVEEDPGSGDGYSYTRYGNPIRDVLNKTLATLDGGKYALSFSSRVAGITAIFNILKTGDHIICGDDAYSGTLKIIKEFSIDFGI